MTELHSCLLTAVRPGSAFTWLCPRRHWHGTPVEIEHVSCTLLGNFTHSMSQFQAETVFLLACIFNRSEYHPKSLLAHVAHSLQARNTGSLRPARYISSYLGFLLDIKSLPHMFFSLFSNIECSLLIALSVWGSWLISSTASYPIHWISFETPHTCQLHCKTSSARSFISMSTVFGDLVNLSKPSNSPLSSPSISCCSPYSYLCSSFVKSRASSWSQRQP